MLCQFMLVNFHIGIWCCLNDFVGIYIHSCCNQMLGHRLFPHAKFSIWVDSKSQFRRDPLGVLEALLWRTNSVLAISQHGARSNVYEEATAVVKKHKASPEEVEVQLTQYRQDGLPEDKRFNGRKGNCSLVLTLKQKHIVPIFMI